jgi:rare lipoprotein A (peptidoglycan hydrolase)
MRIHFELAAALTFLAMLVGAAPAHADSLDLHHALEDVVELQKDAPSASREQLTRLHEAGTATWYGPGFEGRRTASGAAFNANDFTAAHKSLPFGTRVRVTALDTLASVVVVINDRLPAASRHVIDLSRAAGRILDLISAGVARVRVEILDKPESGCSAGCR